jgi:hypothetical protein
MSASTAYHVGTHVRVSVTNGEEKETRKALVATATAATDCEMYDVIFADNTNGLPREEGDVPLSRICAVEPFELESNGLYSASEMKDNANVLFAKKDYASAAGLYKEALKQLSDSNKLSIGSNVLVASSSANGPAGDLRTGCIGDIENGHYSVIYDDGSDDEDMVPSDRIVFLSTAAEERELQRSIYLNLCRCSMKKRVHGWAVKWASYALGVTQYILENDKYDPPFLKKLADGLYLRGRSFLSANRPNLARIDAENLKELDSARASSLLRDIETHKERQRKLNKKLAVNVAQWVQTAMETNSKIQSERNSDHSAKMSGFHAGNRLHASGGSGEGGAIDDDDDDEMLPPDESDERYEHRYGKH